MAAGARAGANARGSAHSLVSQPRSTTAVSMVSRAQTMRTIKAEPAPHMPQGHPARPEVQAGWRARWFGGECVRVLAIAGSS
jgi:hypothetical protein